MHPYSGVDGFSHLTGNKNVGKMANGVNYVECELPNNSLYTFTVEPCKVHPGLKRLCFSKNSNLIEENKFALSNLEHGF